MQTLETSKIKIPELFLLADIQFIIAMDYRY